jgi:hypothetical protein
MKNLNTKLVLSALGMVLIAAPAFAQQSYRHRSPHYSGYQAYDYQAPMADPAGTYPNPVIRSGSGESVQSGAAFDEGR